MPLQLSVARQDGVVAEHVLFEGFQYQIGRALQSDIVIPHPKVSRQHARIGTDAQNNWYFEDASSTGSTLNGKPVDHIAIADSQLLHLGPIPCLLKHCDAQTIAARDSKVMWRKRQLQRYQQQLASCHSSKALIAIARDSLIQGVGCERAAMLLFDSVSDIQSALGDEPWMQTAQFSGSRSIIRQTIKDRAPIAIGDLTTDSSFSQQASIVRYGLKAAICVPIILEDEPVGVLYGDNTSCRQYFTETELELTRALANQITSRLLFHSIEHKLGLIQ
ncbi:MAG: GAF domain-containing protein [Aestuariibacter sp.]